MTYIDRKAFQQALINLPADLDAETVQRCIEVAHNFPAADVQPVKRGEWIWDENGMDWGIGAWVCSECRIKPETWWESDQRYNPYRCSGGHFCGNCGADMRGEDNV